MEYESITQKVLVLVYQYCRTLKNFRMQFYFIVSGFKIIVHGNPDNNLESLCTSITSYPTN
jgi:hypothetical protein